MSAAIATLYRAAAAAVRGLETAKRTFREQWMAARAPAFKLDVCVLRLELAADAAEQALDRVIGLELPHSAECTAEARVVRKGLRWGDVLELHAHAAGLDAIADDFDRAELAPAPVTAAE